MDTSRPEPWDRKPGERCVLVTGCAGFIGAKTAEVLLRRGYAVIGVDSLNDYYDVRLKEYRLGLLKDREGFSFHKADIEQIGQIEPLFAGNRIDGVINLAARAGVRYSIKNPHVYMTTNAGGTLNLLELMRKYQVKKMVLASTSSLYAGQPMPFSEDLPVNTPISPYAASKKAAEVMLYTYHHLFGFDATVVRYFTVYGPAGRPDMSPFRFIRWIDEGQEVVLYGDGTQKRDFTYVEDIAEGTVQALGLRGYEIVNLGNSTPHTMSSFIETIESLLGKKAAISFLPKQASDMDATWAHIGKAKRLLNWEPEVSLGEGLKRTVAWYRANREWVNDIEIDLSV